MTLFPLTRSVDAGQGAAQGRQAVQPLAQTSAPVVGRDRQDRASRRGEATPGSRARRRGPLAGRRSWPRSDAEAKPDAEGRGRREPKKPAKARIVVVGTADFASNQFLGAQGNRDFFLNIVSWLAEEEDLISDPRQGHASRTRSS